MWTICSTVSPCGGPPISGRHRKPTIEPAGRVALEGQKARVPQMQPGAGTAFSAEIRICQGLDEIKQVENNNFCLCSQRRQIANVRSIL
jgi:hypothetical protein